MRTTNIQTLAAKYAALILLTSFFSYSNLQCQDLALSLQGLTNLLTNDDNGLGETEYPDCPSPKGILRFLSSQSESIRFSNPPVQGEYYYTLRLEYANNSKPRFIDVKDGSSYELDYERYGFPTSIKVKTVCYKLGDPFIYESEWANVKEVQLSRTSGDSLCDQFNGADVIFNKEDSTYTISSTWQNRGWTTTNFLLNIEFCNEQDTQIAFLAFPTIITSDESICSMSLVLQYQDEGNVWHNCDTIKIFEEEDDFDWDANCDGNHPEIIIQDSTLIDSLDGEEYFTIAGFNVEILEVNGLSGIGVITLPFQNKQVIIEFNNLNVNEELQVVSLSGNSSITAVSSGSTTIPGGSISLGNELCIAPQNESGWNEDGTHSETDTIWDPNGFGQNGEYIIQPPYPGYQEGDPYDPNYDPCGFDVNGIHFVTDSLYNEDGCSRDSLTSDTLAQICELDCTPYYWLQENSTTPEGIVFYEAISSTLSAKVDSILEVIEAQKTSQLNDTIETCNELAIEMRAIVVSEGLDSTIIFGENSEYVNPGLALEFSRAPQSSLVHDQRNEDIVNLENIHVNLYNCDLKRLELEAIVQYIANLLQGINEQALLDYLEKEIKSFTSDQVQLYSQPQNWLPKLKELIEQFIEDETAPEDTGYTPIENDINNRERLLRQNQFDFAATPYSLIGSYQVSELLKSNVLQMLGGGGGGGGGDANLLPLEIGLVIEGAEVKIIITEIGFNTHYLTVDAYLIYNLPNGAEQLVFKCNGLRFSPNGFIDEGKLILETELKNIKLFNVAHLNINPTNTFVSWNCNGFKSMSIEGYIEFCNNVLHPLDSLTSEPIIDGEERVKAFFSASVEKLDGYYLGLNIEPFAIAGVDNVHFEVDSAFLDMSTAQSPPVSFPVGYVNENTFLGPDNLPYPLPFWKGFYLQHLNVTVEADGALNDETFSIDLYDAVIDDNGFSGRVVVGYSILPLSTSNLGGWAFSIDSFTLHFLSNHLVGGGFMGVIQIPIFREDCSETDDIDDGDCFNYSVEYVDGDGLQFSISPKTQMCVDIWTARVLLDSNTVIHAHKRSSNFLIEANLCGVIAFDNSVAEFPDSIRFEDVRIRNQAPYFSPGRWEVPRLRIGFDGFGVTIDNARMDTIPGDTAKTRLSFTGGIEINSDFSLKAQAAVSIVGNIILTNGGRQKWVYEETKIHGVHVETDIKGTHIEGGLLFFEDDSTFGSGFKAELDVTFPRLNIDARAMGIFGKINSEWDYFNVDALIEFNPGLPVMGPLEINGLGGGLSHNMSSIEGLEGLPTNMDIENDSLSILQMPLGQTLTGVFYEPDFATPIALKLIVAGIIKDPTICSYNAVFEVKFSSTGISRVVLMGNVKLMDGFDMFQEPFIPDESSEISDSTLTNWQAPPIDAPIKGYFKIDFSPEYFSGKFALYMNAGTQQDTIIYGKAMAEIYIDEKQWYLNVGRLKDDTKGRVQLTLDVAFLVAKVEAYLNIGTGIPAMPDPPPLIKEMFPDISSPDASLGWGTGFAFGLGVDVKLNIPIIIGSIKLKAGFGFDLSIKHYDNAICTNTGSELGINGWYTTGQAYLYVIGDVELFGADLISLSAGILVQAGFPNPTWIRGNLKLEYKIWFVEGNIYAKVNKGTPCVREGEDGEELPPIIYSVLPREQSTNVDVLSSIHVNFNVPINDTFSYKLGEDDVEYRTMIDYVELKSSQGFTIGTQINYDDDKLHAELIPEYTLPGNDSFTFTIRVKVYKDNVELTELHGLEKIVGFRTGRGLIVIPEMNLRATYPVNGMVNFYRDENLEHKGYLLLQKNQYELVAASNSNTLAAILSSPNQKLVGKAFYNTSQNKIEFPLPPSFLENGQHYKIEIGITSLDLKGLDNNLKELSENDYQGIIPVWSGVFRVSIFNRLFDKAATMAANMDLDLSTTLTYEEFMETCLAIPLDISEPFDEKEVLPYDGSILGRLKEKERTLLEIKMDMNIISSDDSYASEWEWLDELLKTFSDPFTRFNWEFHNIPSQGRYKGLNESVYLGPDCTATSDFLHPPITYSDFDNAAGVSLTDAFLEPSQIESLEAINGGELVSYNSNIVNQQYLNINTLRFIGGILENSKRAADFMIGLLVAECLMNEGSRSDDTGPCDPEKLGVRPEMLALQANPWPPINPDVIKIPITFTYTLPGTESTTSIYTLIYTITLN